MRFKEMMDTSNFSIENLDLSEIMKLSQSLPRTKVIDSNIAEMFIIATIEAQDLCQEKITQVERWIGQKKILLDKAEAEATLMKAPIAGHKTAKEKEWFAQCDETVMSIKDELDKARVCKLWLDNKVRYFSMWHYSLKAFIRRDYNIEGASNYSTFSPTPEYNLEGETAGHGRQAIKKDICGEIDWK